ncbi:MAG: tetratricopeptide repeat protein [Flavobacteriales bacterium]
MKPLRLLSLLLLVFAMPQAFAQPGMDEQLAAQYFQQGDHEKAILYYEKLYKKQPTTYYYEQLYKSYSALKRFDEAEKLVKEQMRRQDKDPRFLVDLGALYKLEGEDQKAAQQYEKALKNLPADQNSVRQLATAFTKANELDLALATYEKGRKLLRNEAANFNYEIAGIHAAKGDINAMVASYMDLLEANPSYLQHVQNALGRYVDFAAKDARSDIVRTELLRRIQRDPQNALFQEMLIWMYLQQKDLTSAFVQCKAMDKRFNEGGQRLMDLGGIAVTNKDWPTATKCYEYVIALGSNGVNHTAARLGLIEAMDANVTGQSDPPKAQVTALEQQYRTTITELGVQPGTVGLLKGLARLQAYYLNDVNGAIATLEQAINTPGLDPQTQARLKLDLGDVHILQGDIWDASLLYSQVDLDFKQDVLGHEARLRNAKVSFYAGDFLWSKAQLDVLKASTSKLIANDAMELSLLITDNLGADSNSVPLKLFAHAQLLTFQHRYDDALRTLDSLGTGFPMHSLGDDVLYERYRIAYARHQYPEAAGYLEKVIELYPNDILVDNAMLDLGKLYENELNDKEKAKGWFEKLLFQQSGSIFVPEARDHFRRLRGDHDNLDTPEQKFLNGRSTP